MDVGDGVDVIGGLRLSAGGNIKEWWISLDLGSGLD